jgi:hypothetical protein
MPVASRHRLTARRAGPSIQVTAPKGEFDIMRHFPTRATAPCIAAAIAATTPAAASSLQMIYQASDYPSQTNLLSPIPVAFGAVMSGANGGAAAGGQLFVLTPGKKAWTKTVLHTFTSATQGTDGINPSPNMVADSAGNVWGTTSGGGAYNTGTVFELIKPASKTGAWGYASVLSLPVFATSYGGSGSLAFDGKGNLFGISTWGCSQNDCGSLFEASAASLAGGGQTASVLINFPPNTYPPVAGLAIDPKGNLYGAFYGGGDYPWGGVWQIAPGKKKAPYTFQVIHAFCSILDQYNQCADGYFPQGGVTYSKGVLYGTTSTGGAGYTEINPGSGQPQLYEANGVTFAMAAPAQPGGAWTFTTLHEQEDYIAWNTPGPDYNVHMPQAAPVVAKGGALIFPTALGGVDGGLSNFIYGAVITVDPKSGSDAIVNNGFAVENGNLRSGPVADIYHPFPIHLDAKKRVFGNAGSTYDTSCTCTHYWGDIYMITP